MYHYYQYISYRNTIDISYSVSTASVSSIKDGFLSGSQTTDESEKHDRAPSWKVRLAENTKNKVVLNSKISIPYFVLFLLIVTHCKAITYSPFVKSTLLF